MSTYSSSSRPPFNCWSIIKAKPLSDINTFDEYLGCSMEHKLPVRDAIYENSALIDALIQQNPYHFSDDNLTIISKWKRFIAGEFYIERLLKSYEVFSPSDDNVYFGCGIFSEPKETYLVAKEHGANGGIIECLELDL